jgi:hypothetical protein
MAVMVILLGTTELLVATLPYRLGVPLYFRDNDTAVPFYNGRDRNLFSLMKRHYLPRSEPEAAQNGALKRQRMTELKSE